jgi:hypothetical protein
MLSDTDEKSAGNPIFSPRTPHNHRLHITLELGQCTEEVEDQLPPEPVVSMFSVSDRIPTP